MSDMVAGRLEGNTFVVERQVRWGECDPAGIVYTPNFVDYAVDTARLYWRAIARREFGRDDGCGLNLPVKHLTTTFHNALACDDRFTMRAELVRVGNASFDIRVRGEREGQLAFEATATFVSIATAPRRALAIPSDIRAVIGRMISK